MPATSSSTTGNIRIGGCSSRLGSTSSVNDIHYWVHAEARHRLQLRCRAKAAKQANFGLCAVSRRSGHHRPEDGTCPQAADGAEGLVLGFVL